MLRRTLTTLLASGWLILTSVCAQAGEERIPMLQVKSGAFYVRASLDAVVETEMLLDTGSGYVSLSSDTFSRVEGEPGTTFQRYITGVMADGKAVRVPIYSIRELRLSEHCILYDIEVAVFKNASRDILGLSALKQLQPLTLQLDPPVLTAQCVGAPT